MVQDNIDFIDKASIWRIRRPVDVMSAPQSSDGLLEPSLVSLMSLNSTKVPPLTVQTPNTEVTGDTRRFVLDSQWDKPFNSSANSAT